ncbi:MULTISPECIES: hypothetical protein [Pseudoalteromonas]|uniref:hypothetical protein n=1 Tax=Pseudoalteromonas TaxID=53246 RepID=UPI0004A44655|nr:MULTISPECIES: hypothetical protein [unclassified Pseudoalteromonas]MCP4589038.1 hypothetical protein [Pseudoalteromonas sp.]
MISDKVNRVEFDAIISRLHKKLGTEGSDRQLSIKIGLSPSGISASRRSGNLPFNHIVETYVQYGYSVDELIYGKSADSTKQKAAAPTSDDALRALDMVEKILERELYSRNLPADRLLTVANKLRPVLIKACFENDFCEPLVETMAKGALTLA